MSEIEVVASGYLVLRQYFLSIFVALPQSIPGNPYEFLIVLGRPSRIACPGTPSGEPAALPLHRAPLLRPVVPMLGLGAGRWLGQRWG